MLLQVNVKLATDTDPLYNIKTANKHPWMVWRDQADQTRKSEQFSDETRSRCGGSESGLSRQIQDGME